MKIVSCLVVLTFGAVLAASTDRGTVAAAAPSCDRLLTLQDVTKAAGPGFNAPPKEAAAVLGPGCFYSRRAQQAGSYLEENVFLTFKENPGGAAPKLAELSGTYRMSGLPVEAASGLGPGAFYVADTKQGSTGVFFGKGNLYFQLTYKVGKKSDPNAALTLAKVVYGRL